MSRTKVSDKPNPDGDAITKGEILGWIGNYGWGIALLATGLIGWQINERNQERFAAVMKEMTLHNDAVKLELRELRADSAKVERRAMDLKRVFSDFLSGSETDKGKLLGRLAEDQAILSAIEKAAEGDFNAAVFSLERANPDDASAAAFFLYDAMGRKLNDPLTPTGTKIELRAAMQTVEARFPGSVFVLRPGNDPDAPEGRSPQKPEPKR